MGVYLYTLAVEGHLVGELEFSEAVVASKGHSKRTHGTLLRLVWSRVRLGLVYELRLPLAGP